MSTKKMSRIVMLSALAIALRVSFGAFPNIKPISALFFVCVLYLSFRDALCIMAITMIGTSFLFGFGIVVFWQVLSFTLILTLWKILAIPLTRLIKQKVLVQSFLAGIFIFLYGFVISLLSALQFGIHPIIYWLNGIPFDVAHALSTALFYPIILHIFRRFYHEKMDV
ncbi:hypothetical protein AB1I63_00515 [Streptococcus pneumoniae]